MSNQKLTDKDLMPFGKHKGMAMCNVPADYFHYMITVKGLCTGSVYDYAMDNIHSLEKELKQDGKGLSFGELLNQQSEPQIKSDKVIPNNDKLIIALLEEKIKLMKHDHDTTDHDLSIEFLKTGKLPDNTNIEYYEILYNVINDFDTIYSDYVLNP